MGVSETKKKKFRTQIYLSHYQVEVLDEKSKKAGITRSELIRRIIDRQLGIEVF